MTRMRSFVESLFKDNETDLSLEVCEQLLELCRSLLSDHPILKIDVSSEVFQDLLLCTVGAIDILYAIGYQEDEDCFRLPVGFDRQLVQSLQSSLEYSKSAAVELLETRQKQNTPHLLFEGLPPTFNQGESNFQAKLLAFLNEVQQHEDSERQKRALNLLPLDDLVNKAKEKSGPVGESTVALVDQKDLLLLELLVWFKESFFRWVDVPKCPWCGIPCTSNGMGSPSPAELLWGAHRIEAYSCLTCHVNVRFPRYNDPGHLLVTRKGRCGEWANCFLLFLRALNYEARFVNDNKDHVWTEVYSESQKRWLHCDPCECACDKPLLYEKGWKKDLTLVYAFAADHLQDVTWRYTSDHRSVISKRKELREDWLIAVIHALTTHLQRTLSPERKQVLLNRRICELVDFLSPPVSTSNSDLQGRTSGSLAWRLARGESHGVSQTKTGFVFTPLPSEVLAGKMEVVYSPVTDNYKRLSTALEEGNLRGWSSGTWDFQNIFRKEEHDWKQVYLCVEEGSNKGHLAWRFLMQGASRVQCVSIVCKSTVFQKGIVWWTLSDGKTTVDIHNGELQDCSTFDGATELILRANLICGEFWQHAQLFRMDTASRPSPANFPLHVSITFSRPTEIECKS